MTMTMRSIEAHHPEVYVTDGTQTVGWHCLTCGDDSGSLASLADADRGAEQHIADAAIAEVRDLFLSAVRSEPE